MKTYYIRSRQIDWHEVNQEKAIKYANTLNQSYGLVGIRRLYLKVAFINRFVKGLENAQLQDIFKKLS